MSEKQLIKLVYYILSGATEYELTENYILVTTPNGSISLQTIQELHDSGLELVYLDPVHSRILLRINYD